MNMFQQNWSDEKYLCVGLDPKLEDVKRAFPHESNLSEAIYYYCRTIINATKAFACSYKPNFGFFAGKGLAGIRALPYVTEHIRCEAPHVPIILDSKTGDIGRSNQEYAGMLDEFGVDALTVAPYLGIGTLEEFVRFQHKAVFVLCRTSNKEAGEFQDRRDSFRIDEPLYISVAKAVADLHTYRGNCGLVVGATYPKELQAVRAAAPEVPFLIPGIGAQGGDLASSVSSGARTIKKDGILVNVSSDLLRNGLDGVEAVAEEYHNKIKQALFARA